MTEEDCEFREKLTVLGLAVIDLRSCRLSTEWKAKLVDLIARYGCIFSKHRLIVVKQRDMYIELD